MFEWFKRKPRRHMTVSLTVMVDGRTYRQGNTTMTPLSEDLSEIEPLASYQAAVIRHQIKNGHTE